MISRLKCGFQRELGKPKFSIIYAPNRLFEATITYLVPFGTYLTTDIISIIFRLDSSIIGVSRMNERGLRGVFR